MNTKITKKMTALLLTGAMFTLVPACSLEIKNEVEVTPIVTETIAPTIEPTIAPTIVPTIEPTIEPTVKPTEEPIYKPEPDTLESDTIPVFYAYSLNRTNIYASPDSDSDLLGIFAQDRYFELISCDNLDYCIIDYYGRDGYVSKNDIVPIERRIINMPMIAKGYLPKKAPIYETKELDQTDNILEKLEFVEIYKEYEDCYLVETIDYVGYVKKEDVKILEGTMVVIDRSSQEMKLYEDNEMTIKTPVVTGTRNTSRESDLGLFTVHTKAKNLYIIPNYWVDCVAYYNGGEGIHTAEWRTEWEFGGDTYLTNGSHGCINTPHDEAMYIYDAMPKGNKVLVKE